MLCPGHLSFWISYSRQETDHSEVTRVQSDNDITAAEVLEEPQKETTFDLKKDMPECAG